MVSFVVLLIVAPVDVCVPTGDLLVEDVLPVTAREYDGALLVFAHVPS